MRSHPHGTPLPLILRTTFSISLMAIALLFLHYQQPLPTPSLFDCGVEEVGDGVSCYNGCAGGDGIGQLWWCQQQ
jgi:hypothetical protein